MRGQLGHDGRIKLGHDGRIKSPTPWAAWPSLATGRDSATSAVDRAGTRPARALLRAGVRAATLRVRRRGGGTSPCGQSCPACRRVLVSALRPQARPCGIAARPARTREAADRRLGRCDFGGVGGTVGRDFSPPREGCGAASAVGSSPRLRRIRRAAAQRLRRYVTDKDMPF